MEKVIGFYYHIPFWKNGKDIYIPSFLGVFIDELASQVNKLVLVLHEDIDRGDSDYKLESTNIQIVSLGLKKSAWYRMIFYKSILREKLKEIAFLDYLIVRSPSPLAPFFSNYLDKKKIVFMVVGDYSESRLQMEKKSIRSIMISGLLKWNNYLFLKKMKQTHILVNSPALFEKYNSTALKVSQIRTTTLSEKDFFERVDTCQDSTIRLLYTGRIDLAKGLIELVSALGELNKLEFKYFLDIVGWENEKEMPVQKQIIKHASRIGQQNQIKFHGKMSVGLELNQMYRQSDIYLIPSYHEGFPRTIWESMANSCPVIATKVGSIPYFLKDNFNAILIEPKNISAIVNAVLEIIKNPSLRKKIIKSGYELAKTNTLEFQTKDLLNKIYL